MADAVSDRALGRALLARQGLLERHATGLVEAVERIGAIQAQHWPAVPVALWSRLAGFTPDRLHEALADGRLVAGTFLRGTLHLVSAADRRTFAVVAEGVAPDAWRRTKAPIPDGFAALREAQLAFARDTSRTNAEFAELFETRIAADPSLLHPEEVAAQRAVSWRPMLRWAQLVRVPADGAWGKKAPAARRAAASAAPLGFESAMDAAVRHHLRAFGPAAAEDTANWLGVGVAVVRAAVDRLRAELVDLADEAGRTLHDLVDAPRPDPDVEALPRLLPAFDSCLLAHLPEHRGRIVSPEHRRAIYQPKNLRLDPTFLVDGRVAGTWKPEIRARTATLALSPLAAVPRGARSALEAEAIALLGVLAPGRTGEAHWIG